MTNPGQSENSAALIVRENEAIFQTYRRLPIAVGHADRCYIYDVEGRRYLDFLSGIAVNALGHGHPRIISAVNMQTNRFMHLSNFFYQEPQIRLAELLKKASGYERVFFSNSGAESFEGSVKLARLWGAAHGKTDMLAFTGGFHGRTYGSLSLMDKPLYKNGMGPFLPNMGVIPFNDTVALRAAVTERVCGVALEFLQGEGGIIPASTEFVETLKALRKEHGFLIIADEVQAGIGRTGTFFGFEQFDIRPDIVTTAKGLGGGLPLGAILTDDTVASLLQRGMHGTTYGGNAVACAAGAVVVDEVTNSLMENVGKLGLYLRERLLEKAAEFPQLIKEIRGQGFMQGIALNSEMPDFVELMLKRGVVSNITAGSVIRILPPLIAGKEEIDEFIVALRDVLTEKDKAA
ncbi:aspartate aminotransferase family protein [Ignavibacteria bacterium]|nr:acetylornithine/succinylornithine family transaminase [Bacteroidota bacterium]MCZ2131824.1 acetylornithine/succinylornithine family transaminase [Bacteroidota bacterium]